MSRREQFLEALGLMPEWLPRARGAHTVEPSDSAASGEAKSAATAEAAEIVTIPDPAAASGALRDAQPSHVGIADPSAPEYRVAEPQPQMVSEPLETSPGLAMRAATIAALDWEPLARHAADCQACALCERRTQAVFGVGDRQAEWMFIGEGPGEQEDLQGEPFVGQSGKLLDNMLFALGVSRQKNVYIANTVKCRPPGNRDPQPAETEACEPYLQRQIALLRPRLIVVLGKVAAHRLLRTEVPVSRLRGQVHDYAGIPVVVTYHPSYLLRAPNEKAKAWDDLCLARAVYERSPSARPA